MWGTGNGDGGDLFFALRKGVNYQRTERGAVLTLDYPLKVIRLDPAWNAVFDRLAANERFSLQSLPDRVGLGDSAKLERFLNGLVRKGFLERSGVERMAWFPFVSVIIPVRNREKMIAECLRSLEGLDYPPDRLEIIVADDASTDNTPEIVSGFDVKLISLSARKQASFCRNTAAGEASGDILAFIDSDCLADPLWLKELMPAFRDSAVGAVGGIVEAPLGLQGFDRYERVRSPLKVSSWYRRSGRDDRLFYLPSCSLLVRRDLFMQVGGFRKDLHVGEDVDLCWRLQDHGSEVEYRPAGKIYHKHRNRLRPFCARRFQYGTSEPMLQDLHPKRAKNFLIPPGAFLFWCATFLSAGLRFLPLAAVGVGLLFGESWRKFRTIRKTGIPASFETVGSAVFRSYLGFFYHCCAFISRYYLVWALLFLPLFFLPSLLLLGMHLLTGTVEYRVKKPDLAFPAFLFYFTLDQVSYQTGVWWGCARHLNFCAVIPRIKTHS